MVQIFSFKVQVYGVKHAGRDYFICMFKETKNTFIMNNKKVGLKNGLT